MTEVVERTELAPGYKISRLIRGGWQLAGDHGPVDRERAINDMLAFPEAGITAFDCADIYTGVEEMIGAFRNRYRDRFGAQALAELKIHTKFAPDHDALPVPKSTVTDTIDRSLRRLGQERLDLVQFHWWRYDVPGCIETAFWLDELRHAGKIDQLGATNFDTPHLAAMVDAGIPLRSLQIQYSLLDRRPDNLMLDYLRAHQMKLLAYGVLAGGFLTDTWLGRPAPTAVTNRSLIKYGLVIEDFGGWELFQELLRACRSIGDKHGVSIANVATRWVLDRPGVGGVIIGARYADRVAENLAVFSFALDDADRAELDAVLARGKGPQGDTYAQERDKTGRHGRIMKYNLNSGSDNLG